MSSRSILVSSSTNYQRLPFIKFLAKTLSALGNIIFCSHRKINLDLFSRKNQKCVFFFFDTIYWLLRWKYADVKKKRGVVRKNMDICVNVFSYQKRATLYTVKFYLLLYSRMKQNFKNIFQKKNSKTKSRQWAKKKDKKITKRDFEDNLSNFVQ